MKKILILFLLIVNSCVPVLKLYQGYSKPKPEDKTSLVRYLKKKKIKTDNILVFKDSVSYKKIFREIHGVPELRVFNNLGILIYYRDTFESCSAPAYEFTKVICSSANLKSNDLKTIAIETKNLVTLDNQPVLISTAGDVDYYVFIYWMRAIGRLNKLKVKPWENNLNNVSGCKVRVYKVNMDWQKRWDEKK